MTLQDPITAYWSRWAGEYDAQQSRRARGDGAEEVWRAVWADALGEGPLDLLDAGCGSGHAAITLAGLGHRVPGVDLAGARPEDPIEHVRTEANQSALASFTTLSPERTWTVGDLAEFVAIGGRGPVIVGSPTTVADELERWAEESGVDGFNICAAVRPADLERSAALVTPELRRRGLLPAPGGEPVTLRERIGGAGPHLPATHPGAAHRWEV